MSRNIAPPHESVHAAAAVLKHWLTAQALPLWASAGFDAIAGRFEERLAFDGRRLVEAPIRLLVQARQVHVYALASQRNWSSEALALVERAFASMVRDYCGKGGREGWAYSIARDGTAIDSTRDLYAHAFVLLAVASYVSATGERAALEIAEEATAFLDRNMKAPNGEGYVEVLPGKSGSRRQNPHMHLFEAMLALWECTGNTVYLQRADRLYDLFVRRFFRAEPGVVIEYFDDDLRPAPGDIGRIVEPGHQYEWCWLLRRYERACGVDKAGHLIEVLYRHAERHGHDVEGFPVDEVLLDGSKKASSRRLWPMTEAIRCNLVEGLRGRPLCLERAAALSMLLFDRFLKPAAAGTWIDRLDAGGQAVSDFAPASSLYHLVGAIDELQNVASN